MSPVPQVLHFQGEPPPPPGGVQARQIPAFVGRGCNGLENRTETSRLPNGQWHWNPLSFAVIEDLVRPRRVLLLDFMASRRRRRHAVCGDREVWKLRILREEISKEESTTLSTEEEVLLACQFVQVLRMGRCHLNVASSKSEKSSPPRSIVFSRNLCNRSEEGLIVKGGFRGGVSPIEMGGRGEGPGRGGISANLIQLCLPRSLVFSLRHVSKSGLYK